MWKYLVSAVFPFLVKGKWVVRIYPIQSMSLNLLALKILLVKHGDRLDTIKQ